MQDVKKVWDSSLNEIELEISKANFNTWFKNTFIAREENGTIYLGVPNSFTREWFLKKFHKTYRLKTET